MRLRLLAIAWIMLTIAVEATNLVERNRRNVGSLFSDSDKREDFNLFGDWMNNPITTTSTISTTEVDLRASHTILLDHPASNSKLNKRLPRKSLESFSDSKPFQNSIDEIDPESLKPHIRVKRRSNYRRSIGKPPSYVHRVPRRTFERFLSEEMNPADESEAEYGSNLDDDIDVPGIFLNDEISNKRNKLEDVYPDVKSHSVKRDHSPPEFFKSESDSEGTTRQKREKERDGECANEEDGEEYYYDEEDETENRKNGERESQAIASKASSSINSAKEAVDQSESNQVVENNQNSNIEEVDRPNSRVNEKYVATLVKDKQSAKKPNHSIHNNKPKPKKKPPAPKKPNSTKKSPPKSKSHSHKQTPKGKTRPMSKPKPKSHKKSKSNVAALVDSESDQLKGENQENFAGCCGKSKGKEKERNKKVKTLVIKAVPKSENLQELQIYEKPSSSKKVEASKPVAKSNVIERKAEMSMGDMRDLLQRLIGKVDDLRNLVSGIRNNRGDRLEGNSDRINCISKARRPRAAGA